MEKVVQSRIERNYHMTHNSDYHLNTLRIKRVVDFFSKKISPVNSSLNHAAINSNVETAIDQVSNRNYHFDKFVESELVKLNNQYIRKNEEDSVSPHKSITPVPRIINSPIKINQKSNSIKKQRLKAYFLPGISFKSVPFQSDSNNQLSKQKEISENQRSLTKIEKIISDCYTLQNKKLKKLIRHNETKSLDPTILSSLDDFREKDQVSSSKILVSKRKRKLWKQNHYGFIDQIDKKLYSVKKLV